MKEEKAEEKGFDFLGKMEGQSGVAAVEGSGGGVKSGGSETDKKLLDGEPRVKRKMKTTAQLEVLEGTYAVEPYPSEAVRAELSIKLGLSDRQLQMWFCHRRLKDRKAKTRKDGSPAAALAATGDELMLGSSSGRETGNELSSGKNLFSHVDMGQPRAFHHQPGAAVPRIGVGGGDLPVIKRYYEPPQAISELRAITSVEAQLGEPIREDGPILGMEFDPLPPGAFGTPIVTTRQQKPAGRSYEVPIYEAMETSPDKDSKRAIHEYQFLPEQPSIRKDAHERALPSNYNGSPSDVHSSRIPLSAGQSPFHGHYKVSSGFSLPVQMTSLGLLPQQGKQSRHVSPASGDIDIVPRKTSFASVGVQPSHGSNAIPGLENPYMSSERRVIYDEERLEKKRKSEEARIAREVEAHEKRIRKELEKQDLLRRKREEQVRKEMERQERERRKEEERLLREKQREEERYQREQRREMERRERFLQKESLRVEKMRIKEELRKEREAARLKAANERATARRIAKESTELIEDEQLELMELAASRKGLPSMLALDTESLENLESFRGMLPEFPLKSVLIKRPFSTEPWIDSEENVGNILMVWRFLITFADVLGLWPFTLDEFLQAFHDYDARLLGEVHIALLRTIIKDIEDVARTPATAPGVNHSTAVSAEGGHPQIVEGAYRWGFDIRSWQKHLNPLTWPEILRQFALSAGFGPKLKRRAIKQTYPRDENESDDGAEIISNLRKGIAAENALAKMQERGLSNPRRSRHRLTPGTVKFAAFHVLSLEGSKGLTILEVAERIQRSGLRDLSTSRTPEASISAALSRDTKLFERTAPCTYCVRAPYRKDPADAESILAEAREKVQVYINGHLDGEEADDVEKEGAERDEDSDSEEADDPEVEDLDPQLNPNKEKIRSHEVSIFEGNNCFGDRKNNSFQELIETPEGRDQVVSGSSLGQSQGHKEARGVESSAGYSNGAYEATISNKEDTVIDENDTGEPWVQGLTEGDYSDLSVQERLDALVLLINVANEGNSIRVVLEERLEAANTLKKQMWAEAQLDKRRLKEDYSVRVQYSSYVVNRADHILPGITAEGRQSPLLSVAVKSELPSSNTMTQEGELGNPQIDLNVSSDICTERKPLVQEVSGGGDNQLLQQSVHAFEMSRSQLKSYVGHKAEEMYVYRSLPLGQDRRRNRYWQFMASLSQGDPGLGRIFVELRDGRWRLIDSIEDFDALLASLDVRGLREAHLHTMLQKIEVPFKETVKRNLSSNSRSKVRGTYNTEISQAAQHLEISMHTDSPRSLVCVSNSDIAEPSSSFVIELGRNKREKLEALKRYQDYEKWTWEKCFSPTTLCSLKYGERRCESLLSTCDCCHYSYHFELNNCPSCHSKLNSSVPNMKLPEHVNQGKEKLESDSTLQVLESPLPLKFSLLKAQLASIEACIPPEALEPAWSEEIRKSWGMKLHMASSAEDLLQSLTSLEGVIRKDFLSSNYETTNELLGPRTLMGSVSTNSSHEEVAVLPWIPETTSAVAFRLMDLDSSICYTPQQKEDLQKNKFSGSFEAPPSKYPFADNITHDMLVEHLHEGENVRHDSLVDMGVGHPSTSRGRGRGRPRTSEGKSLVDPKSETGQRSTKKNYQKVESLSVWKGQPRGGRDSRRQARRSVRSRQKSGKQVADNAGNRDSRRIIIKRTFVTDKQEQSKEQTPPLQTENTDNISSSDSPSDYENTPGSVDEYNNLTVAKRLAGSSRKSSRLMEDFDYGIEEDDEEHVNDDEGDDEGDDYEDDQHNNEEDAQEYYHGESDEGKTSTGGDQFAHLDEDSRYSSSDYSD